ncbi:alpha-N-arabinofuranosidase [Streptomyces sp. NRRL F-5126]|uniref:arabinosylfuranosidase ArfA n=1 Tax=Streptomyces sp. NRRL F-5126 TaxID=1463857 RepID=UPI0004CA1F90|nr:alpha-N-arabinofuranosidase [Streptomyces sp. NRRL F-5126]
MFTCTATLDPAFTIAPVPPRLFGSFVEHMGRCVHGGIHEPGHPRADADGLRHDVIELTRELGVSAVRYPGGNFVSGYRWEDGVGPRAERPKTLDLAWRSIEPNTFGLNEFMAWARRAGVEPLMAVNLGTRGVEDACNLLEYANFPGGTRWSDLRIAHGVREPHRIRTWCLGNEMDGPWQIGHKTATEYGRLAAETAKAMRRIDPDIELVACGSSNERMETFGSWEAQVLDEAYDVVDHISLHAYFEQHGDDRTGFLASAQLMDSFIDGVVATCDHIAAKRRSPRRLTLSFDEWNVWHESRSAGEDAPRWARAPRLIEEEYTAEDAVVVGNLLMSLLRHSDRVAIACLAQLVNVIAPIRTEPGAGAWRQTVFHPFALTARHARGEVLRVEPVSPALHSPTIGDVAAVDVAATRDPETGGTTILAVNRDERQPATLRLRMAEGGHDVVEHVVLGGRDLRATNSRNAPHLVEPRGSTAHFTEPGGLTVLLPPVSWSMIRTAQRPAAAR